MIENRENVILKIVGSRMKEGRELCKLTLKEAAEALRLDARALKNIEAGFDIETLPLKYVRGASELYDVTCDYLFGFVDDWEKDPGICFERDFGVGLHRARIRELAKISVELAKQQRQIEAMSKASKELIESVEGICSTVERFRELNPGFDDLRAGATLLNRAQSAIEAAQEARCQLVRCKALPYSELKPREAQ